MRKLKNASPTCHNATLQRFFQVLSVYSILQLTLLAEICTILDDLPDDSPINLTPYCDVGIALHLPRLRPTSLPSPQSLLALRTYSITRLLLLQVHSGTCTYLALEDSYTSYLLIHSTLNLTSLYCQVYFLYLQNLEILRNCVKGHPLYNIPIWCIIRRIVLRERG